MGRNGVALASAVAAMTMPPMAAPASAHVSDNHTWNLTCNGSGYRLTSKYPVSRFIEAGVESTSTEEVETIYLGKSCDASHKLFGKGAWCWANGGFHVTFKDHQFGFPRQELSCPDANHDTSGCGC